MPYGAKTRFPLSSPHGLRTRPRDQRPAGNARSRFLCCCASALVACCAGTARADLPPPPPAVGFKRVPYENVVKLETEVPGYKFFTFQRLGVGGQETIGEELALGTERGVAVPSSSSPSVRTGVVAVPDTVMDELETQDDLAKLLSRDREGELPAGTVIYETSGTIADVPESDPRSKVENVIVVSRDERVGVKFTAHVTPAPPTRDASSAAPTRPRLATLIAGLAASLAIASLGVWYVRRK